MKFGVTFPQTEIGNDPGAIREFAQVAEELGYEHILIAEHVLGADPVKHPILAGPYTNMTPFHEPFVLLGYLAGVTSRIKLTTGVVVLPQPQTALVANQAPAVDVL
ncbi:MAG: LLM class flavin-dependent oxidoreductase, partial [Chloroflexota bacterium]|nr:LLM class flavin-dependent oxidoreductase [Chloroflexota bacterium]